MSQPEDAARDLARRLHQEQEENRKLRDRWNTLKRLVLGEWQRGSKMPYSIVKPFLEGNGHAVRLEPEDEQEEQSA